MGLKQIKKRVSSIKNIGKITSALGMVAASKVQLAQDKHAAAKPYADKVYELVNAAHTKEASDIALLRQPKEVNGDLYVLVSTNRGLVGSLNTSLFAALAKHLEATKCAHKFVTLGNKGRNFALRNGELISDFSDKEPAVGNIPAIVETVIGAFTEGAADKVYLVYSEFENVLLQTPVVKELLPVSKKEPENGEKSSAFTFEPSLKEVLESLLVFYVENQIREAILSAEASEHAARMVAMKGASDNAKELSHTLSLEYNKARQAAITTEIADVVTSTASVTQ